MPTFEFDDGPDQANFFLTSVSNQVVATINEDGVNFTWSVNAPTSSVGYNDNPGINGGTFLLTNTTSGATWTLDAQTASGGTDLFNGSFTGNVAINANFQSGTWNVTFHGATAGMNYVQSGINVAGNMDITATSGSYSKITFTETTGTGGMKFNSLTTTAITCFCAGTRIATPQGYALVETLTAGDTVLTADGQAKTVRWLGVQTVDVSVTHPARVNPICISAGALGHGLPERDLHVSPDHGIAVDGVLVNASALVNGRSIYRRSAMPLNGFAYYHVECDAHELLLAEGMASESYVDVPSRAAFDNSDERANAPKIAEMDMVRITSARLLPKSVADRIRHFDTTTVAA